MKVLGAESEEEVDSGEILDLIEQYEKENDVFVQIFDPSFVVGKEHLIWAHNKAETTFKNGTNRASDLGIEVLLWSSAEWQIKDALKKMGVEGKIDEIALMTDGDGKRLLEFLDLEKNDDILEMKKEKLRKFGIKNHEMESVDRPEDLIFEKMATSIL